MRNGVLLVVFLMTSVVYGQSTQFPDAWVGTWAGLLDILDPQGVRQQVPLTLTIGPAQEGRWGWTLAYGDQPPRRYTLAATNSPADRMQVDRADARQAGRTQAGQYVIDEHNGIVLGATWFPREAGGTLHSLFAVANQLLLATYRFSPDGIVFEIVAAPTATEATGPPETPVAVYDVRTVQHAVLRRVP